VRRQDQARGRQHQPVSTPVQVFSALLLFAWATASCATTLPATYDQLADSCHLLAWALCGGVAFLELADAATAVLQVASALLGRLVPPVLMAWQNSTCLFPTSQLGLQARLADVWRAHSLCLIAVQQCATKLFMVAPCLGVDGGLAARACCCQAAGVVLLLYGQSLLRCSWAFGAVWRFGMYLLHVIALLFDFCRSHYHWILLSVYAREISGGTLFAISCFFVLLRPCCWLLAYLVAAIYTLLAAVGYFLAAIGAILLSLSGSVTRSLQQPVGHCGPHSAGSKRLLHIVLLACCFSPAAAMQEGGVGPTQLMAALISAGVILAAPQGRARLSTLACPACAVILFEVNSAIAGVSGAGSALSQRGGAQLSQVGYACPSQFACHCEHTGSCSSERHRCTFRCSSSAAGATAG
jgi:hypothetical protein